MSRLRVLLVEDNPGDVDLIREYLAEARAPMDVTAVPTLARARELLAAGPPDLVLLDLSLPDSTGLATLEHVLASAPSTPLIVLTGLADENTALHAMQQGAQDYLVKGELTGRLLVRAARYAIERKQAEEARRELAREQAGRVAAEKARLEAERLNRTLDETNRGILALYNELDDKTDSLRRNAEVKSRVVSNVSHEFRTPLNSILGLARLLLSGSEGALNAEQEKQLGFILRSALELSRIVDELLDLSQMESGKVRLHVTEFDANDLLSAMRGLSRPLLVRPDVALQIEDASGIPRIKSDDGKISQVLRNLISNALKFTERGEVRVSARAVGARAVVFTVRDTGIGIAPADIERVFEEFTQLESHLQKQTKGTGLGLSLSRRLAELLGGTLTAESIPGQGSAFHLTIPIVHPEVAEYESLSQRGSELSDRRPVLVVEDDRQTLLLYERYLTGSGFHVIPARTIDDARRALARVRPAAIVLDVMLDGEVSWQFLGEVKSSPATRDIPILVVTVTDRENKARALGADEFWMKPMDPEWLLQKLQALSRRGRVQEVLVIDDDEVSRYLIRRILQDSDYRVVEAAGGLEGIRLARARMPQAILLDFVMPGIGAFEVLDELKAHPETRGIPVIVHTSKDLGEEERRRLSEAAAAILAKQSLSREVALARIRDALVQAGVGQRGDESSLARTTETTND